MMGIMVPETCRASNKICNKNHLLHLVGILFPNINDDARSKPHQIMLVRSECHPDIVLVWKELTEQFILVPSSTKVYTVKYVLAVHSMTLFGLR